jgi:hypothetical protein
MGQAVYWSATRPSSWRRDTAIKPHRMPSSMK